MGEWPGEGRGPGGGGQVGRGCGLPQSHSDESPVVPLFTPFFSYFATVSDFNPISNDFSRWVFGLKRHFQKYFILFDTYFCVILLPFFYNFITNLIVFSISPEALRVKLHLSGILRF